MNEKYILEVKDLEYTYGDGTHALKGINLKIEKGKKIAIIGVNGSGKSTLFLNMNGVLKATKGEIYFKGEKIAYDKKSLMELRKKIGIVFQNPETMLFSSNVYQEVSFGAMNLKLDNNIVHERVQAALEDVNMTEFSEKSIHFLSYGQKKRVTIASVLVLNPEIIILDEPTAGQDFYHYNEIMSFLIELNRQGKTIIMITHDMHLLSEYSSRTIVLSKGQVVADTTPVLVLNDKKICEIASLRQTSLFEMAEYIGISEPQKLVQLFINHDRKVRRQ